MRHEDCWAKTVKDAQGREIPGISVRDHCLNVGCMAEALIERLPATPQALLPPGVATLAALHDIGKVSPGFQQQCPAWRERNASWFHVDAGYQTRHALVSERFLLQATNDCLPRAAMAIGAHHGSLQGYGNAGVIGEGLWHDARMGLVREMEAQFGPLPGQDLRDDATAWLLAGLIAVADWIASDERRFSPENLGPLLKAEQQRVAEQAVVQLALAVADLAGGNTFEEVFADRLAGSRPRPLQRKVLEMPTVEPAVYVIEDAMGSGKTEAALWLAYRLMAGGHARGLAFALPTRVTSDRIHRRVEAFLKHVSPGSVSMLVHGQAWLRDMPAIHASQKDGDDDEEDAAKAARKWFASTRRGLLAPFAVGTVDQALLAVMAAKWFFVRQFGLAGKVVVLDEVHSYDLYTGTLIRELVRQLRNLKATPVILSATLTARQKADLLGDAPPSAAETEVPYPALTARRGGEPPRLLDVQCGPKERREKRVRIVPVAVPSLDEPDEVVSLAVRLAEENRNVVWIRNTVRHAQESYRKLNATRRGTDYEIGLLHSRFPAFQRAGRPDLNDLDRLKRLNLHEERWLWMLGKPEAPRGDARPQASILVSTQVVEQSVDIDADVLITDLAPTDMLLQRLGRLHRHDRGDRGQPTVYLIVPQVLMAGADRLSTEDIRQALGPVGRVYDPYVLLRTWEQWRGRETVALPRDIRCILEATYADAADEPQAWRELREALERKKQALQGRALNAADVRNNPLGPDTEGFGTRLGQPQLLLLMLRYRNPAEIQLLSTKKLTFADFLNFSLPAARHLHLNAAAIPAWWVPYAIRRPLPPALAQYFTDDVVLGVWNLETGLVKLDLKREVEADTAPWVCYRPDRGLWLDRPPLKQEKPSGDDEEYDDGIL
jgi:CRISPR-associated endonuclease/helicase Cas3